jgi:hypothetical protein
MPGWFSELKTPEEAEAAVEAWFDAVLTAFPDIEYLEVSNEVQKKKFCGWKLLGGDGETGYDAVIKAYDIAKRVRDRHGSKAKLGSSEISLLYTSLDRPWVKGYWKMVNALNEKGLIDYIGFQGHWMDKRGGAKEINAILDEFAKLGKPIYITEFDIRGDDAKQLATYQEEFKAIWEHPAVKGVNLWGYKQGGMWTKTAFLEYRDGSERPAMAWLRQYFDDADALPAPPTDLVTAVGVSSVGLSWQDHASNETGFRVCYKKPLEKTWHERYAKPNTPHLLITGLSASKEYELRVASVNRKGASESLAMRITTHPRGTNLLANGGAEAGLAGFQPSKTNAITLTGTSRSGNRRQALGAKQPRLGTGPRRGMDAGEPHLQIDLEEPEECPTGNPGSR